MRYSILLFIYPFWVIAAPPPEPLTLNYAIKSALSHPQLQQQQAQYQQAQQQYAHTRSQTNVNIHLSSRLSLIERQYNTPPTTTTTTTDDHQLSLIASKQLYDFGHQRHQLSAAQANIQRKSWEYIDAKHQHYLKTMRNFFAVLLADKQYTADNEAMAIAFVRFDRAKSRHALKQTSDLVLLQHEHSYQNTRHQRHKSQLNQRITRALLANTINHPNELSSNLEEPDLSAYHLAPDTTLNALQQTALTKNPKILALTFQIQTLQQQIRADKTAYHPTLNMTLMANARSLEQSSYDHWRAELNLDIPLYNGKRKTTQTGITQAKLVAAKSILANAKMQLQQTILELWLKLDELKSEQQRLQVLADFRELELDNSRSLYEMEANADLGDAMTEQSKVNFLTAKLTYDTALVYAELQALLGNMP